MFGRWEFGRATIVARQVHEGMYHAQGPTGPYHTTYDYVADVEPDSGAPAFRATFTELFTGDIERQPDVGDQARVKFHAKDHKTKFDRSALAEEASAEKDADRREFDALAHSAPAASAAAARPAPSDPPGPAQAPAAGPADGPVDRLKRLEELAGLRDRGVLSEAEFAAEKQKILADDA